MTVELEAYGYSVESTRSPQSFFEEEKGAAPEIVICEHECCDQLETIVAEKFPRTQNVQFIQLLSDVTTDAALSAFDHSNRDCLNLPYTANGLALSVARAVERRNWLTKNQRIHKKMEKTLKRLEQNLAVLKSDQLAGRRMQQSLLPTSPIVNSPYYYARTIKPSLYLSGDFVNYTPALDDFLLFYLLDVSGHGASSAFVTVMVRQLMRRIVRKQTAAKDSVAIEHAPEGFLERINTVLLDNDFDKHLTMFAGRLDKKKNILRYSIAAQLPMPILIHDGKAEFLKGKGRPVGLFSTGAWVVEELVLPEKFILLAFSDGILEVLPQKTLAEQEAFLLKSLCNVEANIDNVLPALGISQSGDFPDDIAVFMLARGYH